MFKKRAREIRFVATTKRAKKIHHTIIARPLIIEAIKAGLSDLTIARKLGTNRMTVYRIRKKLEKIA